MLPAYLTAKNFPEQMACVLHFRYSQGTIHLLAIAASGDDTSRAQHRQVLGHVGLGYLELLLKLRYSAFPFAQHIQQLQSLGMGERLTDDRLSLENLEIGIGSAFRHIDVFR